MFSIECVEWPRRPVSAYICIHIHIHICIYIPIPIPIHFCICVCVCVCICIFRVGGRSERIWRGRPVSATRRLCLRFQGGQVIFFFRCLTPTLSPVTALFIFTYLCIYLFVCIRIVTTNITHSCVYSFICIHITTTHRTELLALAKSAPLLFNLFFFNNRLFYCFDLLIFYMHITTTHRTGLLALSKSAPLLFNLFLFFIYF